MSKNCTKRVNHSRIKVEENNRKAVFKNPDRRQYEISTVDNCLITVGKRTDFLVSEVDSASVFVELKGIDLEGACEQLLASVEHAAIKPLLYKKLGFLVICRRYPRFDSYVAKAKQRIAQKYKCGFHVICDQRELDISRVIEIDGPY